MPKQKQERLKHGWIAKWTNHQKQMIPIASIGQKKLNEYILSIWISEIMRNLFFYKSLFYREGWSKSFSYRRNKFPFQIFLYTQIGGDIHIVFIVRLLLKCSVKLVNWHEIRGVVYVLNLISLFIKIHLRNWETLRHRGNGKPKYSRFWST